MVEESTLKELPKKKGKLEEARNLLERLKSKKDKIDPGRYERLASRYRDTIPELRETVAQLSEEGEARKMELKDRLDHQRSRLEEAEDELDEIESLHEEGVLDRQGYRKDRRRFRRQKKEAKSKIHDIKEKLDEVQFYLTEVGDVRYRERRGEELAESIGEHATGILKSVRSVLPSSISLGRFPELKSLSLFKSTLYTSLVVGAGLFLANWLLGVYLAGKVRPAVDSQLADIRQNEEVTASYSGLDVSPLFRSVTMSDLQIRAERGPNLSWEEATIGVSLGMLWHLTTGGEPNSVKNASVTIEGYALTADELQMQAESLSLEFEGRVSRQMFQEKGSPRALLRHHQWVSVSVEGGSAQSDELEKAPFASSSTVQRALQTEEGGIELSYDPNQKRINVEEFYVERPSTSLQTSGSLRLSRNQAGGFESSQVRVQGEWSSENITYELPDGARYSIEQFDVWTESPLTFTPEDPPIPEGRAVLQIENGLAQARVNPDLRNLLNDLGFRSSALRKSTDVYVDYEYKNQTIHFRESSISSGTGTIRLDGKLDVDVQNRDLKARGLTVRMSGLSSSLQRRVRRTLEDGLGQSIPRDESGLAFQMNGSLDNPRISPVQ